MKGITYCGACADYDIKKHRCKRGAKLESNPQDKFFDDCPLPDAVPVVHGRWIEKSAPARKIYFECSHCGAQENKHTAIKGYYCWRCGAIMDGDSDAKAD